MNEVRLHVRDFDEFFNETRRAARRIDERDMSAETAEVAFETMEGLLRVLTPNRWVLLRTLRALGPSSIRALAKALERDYRGVHADVVTLTNVGLVTHSEDGRVNVPWDRITAEMSLDIAA